LPVESARAISYNAVLFFEGTRARQFSIPKRWNFISPGVKPLLALNQNARSSLALREPVLPSL
jgi:hypothetical protein